MAARLLDRGVGQLPFGEVHADDHRPAVRDLGLGVGQRLEAGDAPLEPERAGVGHVRRPVAEQLGAAVLGGEGDGFEVQLAAPVLEDHRERGRRADVVLVLLLRVALRARGEPEVPDPRARRERGRRGRELGVGHGDRDRAQADGLLAGLEFEAVAERGRLALELEGVHVHEPGAVSGGGRRGRGPAGLVHRAQREPLRPARLEADLDAHLRLAAGGDLGYEGAHEIVERDRGLEVSRLQGRGRRLGAVQALGERQAFEARGAGPGGVERRAMQDVMVHGVGGGRGQENEKAERPKRPPGFLIRRQLT